MKPNVEPHLHRALLERGVPYTRPVVARATEYIKKWEHDCGVELEQGSDGNVAYLKPVIGKFLDASPDVPRYNRDGASLDSQQAGMKRYMTSLRRSDSQSSGDLHRDKLLHKIQRRAS
jgi:hypothetical protein